MAEFELLVGSGRFWSALDADIRAAKSRVHLQAMTFEGDSVGRAVIDAMLASRAPDRRVLVDSFTRHVQSDKVIWAPGSWGDSELRREVTSTNAMFAQLVAAGGQVRCTNPMGFLMTRYPSRNHKKLMVVDDVAYIGGINFSEHNFAWHDAMIRVRDVELVAHLSRDYLATWEGQAKRDHTTLESAEVYSFNGIENESLFADLFAHVEHAKREVVVVSPYVTYPLVDALASAAARGTRVKVITPLENNKPVLGNYLRWRTRGSGIELLLVPGMSHLKAILIDNEKLVFGSSNYDIVSYRSEDELVLVFRDAELIADFRARVVDAELSRAHRETPAVGALAGAMSYAAIKIADRYSALSSRMSRGMPRIYEAKWR